MTKTVFRDARGRFVSKPAKVRMEEAVAGVVLKFAVDVYGDTKTRSVNRAIRELLGVDAARARVISKRNSAFQTA